MAHRTVANMDDPRVVEQLLKYEYRIRGNNPERVNNHLVHWYMKQKPIPPTHSWDSKIGQAIYNTITAGPKTPTIMAMLILSIGVSVGGVMFMSRNWKPHPSLAPEWVDSRKEYEKNAMRGYIDKAMSTLKKAEE